MAAAVIGNIIGSALPAMRAQAESLMTTVCVIERDSGLTEFDEVTNQQVTVWDTVYEGRCRLYTPGRNQPQVIVAGQQQVASNQYFGSLPFGSVGIAERDRLTVTESENPAQVGKSFTITTVHSSSQAVAHRFIAVDDQG